MKEQKSVNKHKPVNEDTSSSGSRPLPLNSTEKELNPFGLTLNFSDSWLKSFKNNYEN